MCFANWREKRPKSDGVNALPYFPLNWKCWSNKQTRSDTFHQRRSLDRSNIFGKNFSFACFGFISLLCIIRPNDNIYSFLSHLNQEILGQEDTFFPFAAQKQPKWGIFGGTKISPFWLFLAPPADLVEFLWFKMAGTGVPHIVLHVSCWTRTSRGSFRPQYSVFFKKSHFLLFFG